MVIKTSRDRGFSEFEFLGLIAAGLLIAGLLAHFFIDQTIQMERLGALVHRDGVRLALESRLSDIEVLKKSAQKLGSSAEDIELRACVLGNEGNQACAKKSSCCVSRRSRAITIYDFGDDSKIIGGTHESPACLNEHGEAVANGDCFAEARVVLDPVCADGAANCRQATALILTYQLDFTPTFLKDDSDLATLERSVSVIVEQ